MRYGLAFFCPPLAFLSLNKWGQAIASGFLFCLAIATARYGVGAVLDFFVVLWASNAVGDEQARREARAFSATVRPIPVIRD